jgi:hypothetical protein
MFSLRVARATRSANDQPKAVIVEGVVVGEPDARDAYANLRVEADKFIIAVFRFPLHRHFARQ